ncbi:MAG: hypothetical protein DHS20C18_41690 [Saprospiraceae bacterium]|nr:MAG: hypothetical protein DHS20C18_41690 [Saprospiraceae bacterium]
MQLKLVKAYFDQFTTYLESTQNEDWLYLWESQRIFQENWDLEATDLTTMYDASLNNSKTRRLWTREAYEPKKMMLKFLELQSEFVRSMFKDLYKESISLSGRVGRFVFYCDELLNTHEELNPKSRDTNHYHDDGYQMISLYLAFRYPDQYTLYNRDAFKKTLKKLGVSDLPLADDLERYAKVSTTLFKLMQKEPKLMELHQNRLKEGEHYLEESLLVVYEFYRFCEKN